MTKLKIFKGTEIDIDLSTLVDSRALICANSGGGKSFTVRKILEESNKKVMSIILDIEGEFRTLREQYDFLLIGNEGDVELNMKSAKLLPQKIMELEVSTIIDISDLKRNERITYVKYFLEALMELPRKYWKPCLIVLDEVHQLAGQQEKQDSTSSVIDLATRGRKRGYSLIGCTQRISKLHKDVVAELNNYMVGRTGLDIDQKRAGEILGFTNKQDVLSLRDLDAGEFYVFGTAISKYVTKVKVGNVKTTHPKVGMDLRKEIIKPTQKIKNMLSKLSDLPKEAEEKLKTEQDYKKKIRELEFEVRKIPKAEVSKEQIEKFERSAYAQGLNAGSKVVTEQSNKLKEEIIFLKKENITLIKREEKIGQLIQIPLPPRPEYKTKIPITTDAYVKPIVKTPFHREAEASVKLDQDQTFSYDEPKLKSGAMRMLKAIGMFGEATRTRVRTISGLSSAGTFSTYTQDLRRAGYITIEGTMLKITKEGVDNVGDIEPMPTDTESLIQLWSKHVKSGAIRMLRVCVDNYPNSILRSELKEEVGIESAGTFSTYTQDLRRNGLIVIEGDSIKASEELFE